MAPLTSPDESPRGRWARWRGSRLAEFAIAFPVFLVVLVAVVDLGVNFGDGVETGRAATAAAHAGAVARVGNDRRCDLASTIPLPDSTERLMCLAKDRTHLDPRTVRVKVFYEGNDGRLTTSYQPTDPAVASDVTQVVCVMSAESSISGLLSAVFDHRAHQSRATARVGVPVASAGGRYPPMAAETPLSGQSWSFCRSDDPGPAAAS